MSEYIVTPTPNTLETRPDIPLGITYDTQRNELTYKNSSGFWRERTYDERGNELTLKCGHEEN